MPYKTLEENLLYYAYTEEPQEANLVLDDVIEQCSLAPCESYCVVDLEFVYQNYVKTSIAMGLKSMERSQFVFSIKHMFKEAVEVRSSSKQYLMGPVAMFRALHADEKAKQ